MIWKVLGIIDFLGMLIVYFSPSFLKGNVILFLFLSVIFAKGAWSAVSSISMGSYLDWMGYIDLLVSFLLFMIFIGNPLSVSLWIMSIIAFKAIYALMLVFF
ncbi:MAG: hypothetical protein U9P44_01120 [archaeon]|nr:hypothetical protein [archaeon]